MLITNLKLQNFRNYKELNLDFVDGINIIYGDNAQGKTNILESIFISAIGKSFRTNKDKELIMFNEDFAKIEADFSKSDRDGKIKIDLNEKKDIYLNGVKIKKLSDLLGNIHIVIFTPDDISILKNGPSGRRRFLDIFIGQLRPKYIYALNMYLKALEQRNNYLKQIKFENKSEDFLDIWDEKICDYAESVFKYRFEFINKLKEKIKNVHNIITENNEDINIEYISDFINKEEFLKKLKENRKLDIIKGYTTKGVHRDDFNIYINNNLVNIYGSQGQHRTAILSLKMSELQVVKDEIGENPILLLDDFMSELDEKRRMNFLRNIRDTQVIITCTEKIIVENLNYKVYNVKSGKINQKI
jgi:DNA replication and repair protein RecF